MLENGLTYLYYAFQFNVIKTSATYTKYKCLDLGPRNLFPGYRLGIYVEPTHNATIK